MKTKPTAGSKSPASSQDIEALVTNFDAFVKATDQLRSSYERLRERAERIDFELAQANEKLREKVSELDHLSRHLHGILSAIPTGVIVTDPEGRISRMNGAAEKILDLEGQGVTGTPASSLRDELGNRLLLGLDSAAGTSPEDRARAVQLGHRKILGGAVSPIQDADGRTVGHVETVEDLTELWDLRERIHHLDKLAALGEMSAVIAHEIRNPLNGVQGFAGLLAEKLTASDEGKLSQYARNIVKGVSEVDMIITDLLAFAAPEHFDARSVELGPILEEAFEAVQREKGGATTQWVCSLPDGPLPIAGDPVKLGQIFRNLFGNAVDAMESKGSLRVTGHRNGDEAVLEIQDEGPGISAEIRETAFDPFITTKTQGTGLGLAIVKKLVELHRGKISLRDADRGACFEIRFPLSRSNKDVGDGN